MICYDMLCYVMTVIGCHRCLPMFGFSGQAETDYGRRRVKLMKSDPLAQEPPPERWNCGTSPQDAWDVLSRIRTKQCALVKLR